MKPDQYYQGDNLAFIVGSQRSGTTWLQKLIASHPNVRSGSESFLFSLHIGPELRTWNEELTLLKEGKARTGLPSYFTQEEFIPILTEHMLNLLSPILSPLGEEQIFLDKTPDHAFYLPEIAQMLPKSKIIHILRDGRDVVASMINASKSSGWGKHWAPSDPRKAARMWVKHVEAVRKAEKLLSKEQFIEVRYEELLSSTPQILKTVMEFIGLKWSEENMNKAIAENTAEATRNTGGTYIEAGGETARILRNTSKRPRFIGKAKVGSWKEDLGYRDRFRVWRVVHRTMDEVGYTWRYPW